MQPGIFQGRGVIGVRGLPLMLSTVHMKEKPGRDKTGVLTSRCS